MTIVSQYTFFIIQIHHHFISTYENGFTYTLCTHACFAIRSNSLSFVGTIVIVVVVISIQSESESERESEALSKRCSSSIAHMQLLRRMNLFTFNFATVWCVWMAKALVCSRFASISGVSGFGLVWFDFVMLLPYALRVIQLANQFWVENHFIFYLSRIHIVISIRMQRQYFPFFRQMCPCWLWTEKEEKEEEPKVIAPYLAHKHTCTKSRSHYGSLVRKIVDQKLAALCAHGFSVNQTSFGINNYVCENTCSMNRNRMGILSQHLVASNVHRLHYVIGMHFPFSPEVYVTMCS